MLASSIDFEPLPLPDSHQQHHHTLFQHMTRDNHMGWSSQHPSLHQMHTADQQHQRINIDSNNQYLRRVSTAGGTSAFPSGWGQNASFIVDANEPILVPLGDEATEKIMSANTASLISQDLDSIRNAKNRIGSNQDFW